MPSTVQQIYQLLAQSAYQEDGVNQAMRELARRIALMEWNTDDLDVTRTNVASATASAVVTSGTANLYAVVIDTAGSACFVQLFDDAAASTTAADMVMVLPCAATTSTVWMPVPRFAFASGMSMSITTTAVGSTAVGTLPTVTLVYRTSTTPLI